MAHLVEEIDRIAAFDGLGSWHGINTVDVQHPKSLEDAYQSSGLNWGVECVPLRFERTLITADGPEIILGETSQFSRAVVTPDPRKPGEWVELGSVGPQYTPIQNRDLFEKAHPFVENGFACYETAGSIRSRRSVWVGLMLGIDYVDSDDPIAKRILFKNSHDGTGGVKVGFCPIRTECANTLAANESRGRFLETRHTKNVSENFQLITDSMDVINKTWLVTMETYRALTKIIVTPEKFDKYITKCFWNVQKLENKFAEQEAALIAEGYSTEQVEAARQRFEAQVLPDVREKVKLAAETAPGARLKSAYGTAWGAYQAVTFYLTHSRGDSAEGRFYSNAFGGEGARINARALRLAQQL